MKHELDDKMAELLNEADTMMATLNQALAEDMDEQRRTQLEATQAALRASRERIDAANTEAEDPKGLTSGYHEAIDSLISAIKETARLLT